MARSSVKPFRSRVTVLPPGTTIAVSLELAVRLCWSVMTAPSCAELTANCSMPQEVIFPSQASSVLPASGLTSVTVPG